MKKLEESLGLRLAIAHFLSNYQQQKKKLTGSSSDRPCGWLFANLTQFVTSCAALNSRKDSGGALQAVRTTSQNWIFPQILYFYGYQDMKPLAKR
jgi:hypothetical protein